jgi:hypothetical protein
LGLASAPIIPQLVQTEGWHRGLIGIIPNIDHGRGGKSSTNCREHMQQTVRYSIAW